LQGVPLEVAIDAWNRRFRDGSPGAGDAPSVVVGGDTILCATRVEPHVLPGQIWATEEFRQELAQKPSLWRTTLVMSPDGGGRFNVKKEGREEPDLWVRPYRLEF